MNSGDSKQIVRPDNDNGDVAEVIQPNNQKKLQNRKLLVVAGLVLLTIIAGTSYLLLNKGSDQNQQPAAGTEQREVTIEITKDGFVPATMLVEPGTQVTWVNKDNQPHYVASNPYPHRTDNPDLDSKQAIGPDQTYTFTITEKKTYWYHDDYNPELSGTIVAE